MALLFMDGFDADDAGVLGKWSAVSGLSNSTITRFGYGRSLKCNTDASYLRKIIAASARVIVGGAIYPEAIRVPVGSAIVFYGDAGITAHLSLRINADGTLKLCLGDGGTTLATSTATVSNARWRYLEMSGTIADSGGRAIVKLDGVTVIDFTGDTKNGGTNTTIDTVKFGASNNNSNAPITWDDVYICDDTGLTNNTFLGDVRVQTLLPTGAGASTQFTPSVGFNWDNVNDAPYVSTTYNSDSVSGHRDTYAMGDLLSGTGTIFGVQDVILALKSDAGAASIKAALKSGATVYYDATINLGTSLAGSSAIREVDPATSAAWTPTNVNALEFGAEVV